MAEHLNDVSAPSNPPCARSAGALPPPPRFSYKQPAANLDPCGTEGRAGLASPRGAACPQEMRMEKLKGCGHHAHSKPSLGLLAPPETRPQAARLHGAQPDEHPAKGGCTLRSCSAMARGSDLLLLLSNLLPLCKPQLLLRTEASSSPHSCPRSHR